MQAGMCHHVNLVRDVDSLDAKMAAFTNPAHSRPWTLQAGVCASFDLKDWRLHVWCDGHENGVTIPISRCPFCLSGGGKTTQNPRKRARFDSCDVFSDTISMDTSL